MDSNFIFYIIAGIAVFGSLYFVKRRENEENLKEFIKKKGWKIVSIRKDKSWYWKIDIGRKNEAFYHIKYYDKLGKLHECSLLAEYISGEFKIIGDDLIEET